MGRTLPTIIQTIRFEEEQWKAYRRALRQEDRVLFDALWRFVRHYAVSAQMANRPVYFEALMMNMLMGVMKMVQEKAAATSLEPPKNNENPQGLDL